MTDYGVLANLLVIFTASIAVVFVFHQFRLPSIAGFLVADALIGPYGLNLISDIGTVQVLAEVGIVLLLFTMVSNSRWCIWPPCAASCFWPRRSRSAACC